MGCLRIVLHLLKHHQLFDKYGKCDFSLRLVFFGNIVSNDAIEVNPKKIEEIKNCPRPLTPTDVRSFLGLVDYYRRFVDWLLSIASPLKTLTQKNAKFE